MSLGSALILTRFVFNPARFILDNTRMAFGGSDAVGNILPTQPIRVALVSDADVKSLAKSN